MAVKHIGLQNYRNVIGTVMQEDVLLKGCIADNISFFDLRVEEQRVHVCAAMAAVHEDIASMPMGYQSLVGDMGSSLILRAKAAPVVGARRGHQPPEHCQSATCDRGNHLTFDTQYCGASA